mmetsp:Transcript_124191/g.359149  ORF Transcript_124191/g.359149 Transcript_124191/m.359149 type:complete len:474 (-) Transcript_124191:13-1434(-)
MPSASKTSSTTPATHCSLLALQISTSAPFAKRRAAPLTTVSVGASSGKGERTVPAGAGAATVPAGKDMAGAATISGTVPADGGAGTETAGGQPTGAEAARAKAGRQAATEIAGGRQAVAVAAGGRSAVAEAAGGWSAVAEAAGGWSTAAEIAGGRRTSAAASSGAWRPSQDAVGAAGSVAGPSAAGASSTGSSSNASGVAGSSAASSEAPSVVASSVVVSATSSGAGISAAAAARASPAAMRRGARLWKSPPSKATAKHLEISAMIAAVRTGPSRRTPVNASTAFSDNRRNSSFAWCLAWSRARRSSGGSGRPKRRFSAAARASAASFGAQAAWRAASAVRVARVLSKAAATSLFACSAWLRLCRNRSAQDPKAAVQSRARSSSPRLRTASSTATGGAAKPSVEAPSLAAQAPKVPKLWVKASMSLSPGSTGNVFPPAFPGTEGKLLMHKNEGIRAKCCTSAMATTNLCTRCV